MVVLVVKYVLMQQGPKIIGTVNLQEIDNVSTQKPWEPVTIYNSPFSVVTQPNGFMFAHGSACASLPSTSVEGWRYASDVYFFRRDCNGVDVDRYLGSITTTQTFVILKISSGQIPYHHLEPTDPIVNNLPVDRKEQVLGILGSQQGP